MTIAPRPCALFLEIDPDPQEFRRASSWLRAGGASLGVPEEKVDRLELCLNEVLANLVEHGGDAVASHTIQLELGVSPVPGGARSCRCPVACWPESALRPAIDLKLRNSTAAICCSPIPMDSARRRMTRVAPSGSIRAAIF